MVSNIPRPPDELELGLILLLSQPISRFVRPWTCHNGIFLDNIKSPRQIASMWIIFSYFSFSTSSSPFPPFQNTKSSLLIKITDVGPLPELPSVTLLTDARPAAMPSEHTINIWWSSLKPSFPVCCTFNRLKSKGINDAKACWQCAYTLSMNAVAESWRCWLDSPSGSLHLLVWVDVVYEAIFWNLHREVVGYWREGSWSKDISSPSCGVHRSTDP